MKTLTIVITDLPKGMGVTVQTNAGAPCVGEQCTPAQALAMDLLRVCKRHAETIQYGQACATLQGELIQAQAEALQ